MKHWILLVAVFVIIHLPANAQTGLKYYLPENYNYDSKVLKPAEYFGFEVGEWHLNHELISGYLKTLAASSDRVQMIQYGKSYEQRPLHLLYISSPENINNLDKIKTEHLKLSDPKNEDNLNFEDMPVVVWLGYSVHGNEPSGANASVLVTYHLAAAQGDQINDLLQNTIIIIDPTLNPDGLNRFAHWANTNKSKVLIADSYDREHNEDWPGGRTNHYWFDLNRDWLLLQHPESQGRIEYFHAWKPNVLTDHHEMGTNSTFFFQPGIPSRTHPLTPGKNQELTRKIASYHADAFDRDKVLYYTQESFDDFYYGKGSTYPDINGSIGILFEQASSRGHLQESVHGNLSFPFTIKNQFTVSLSTLAASRALKNELLGFQQKFYEDALAEARRQQVKAYVVSAGDDPYRLKALADILTKHQINSQIISEDFEKAGKLYPAEKSLLIPLEQKQYKLIEAVFETRTSFTDSLFYDISSWNFPMAMHLDYTRVDAGEVAQIKAGNSGKSIVDTGEIIGGTGNYAYIIPWKYQSASLVYQVLDKGLKASVATDKIRLQEGEFDAGSIVVPARQLAMQATELYNFLQKLAINHNLKITGVKSGISFNGLSLGSPGFKSLTRPSIAMLTGNGTSAYESGEVWHLLDQRMGIPVVRLNASNVERYNLNKYNVLIMPHGSYAGVNSAGKEKISRWLQNGGNLVAMKGAVNWLHNRGLSKAEFIKNEPDTSGSQKPYNTFIQARDAQDINGAIFKGVADLTHPINYGLTSPHVYLFKNSTRFMKPLPNPFANPVVYSSSPLASGYISEENLEKVSNSSAISLNVYGSGLIVNFADNPNFRAFWYGTNRFFINSIFFAPIINRSTAR
ncbi:MAG: M14 metallopeptidase family protein [Cyclobacteriaceae bacterium]